MTAQHTFWFLVVIGFVFLVLWEMLKDEALWGLAALGAVFVLGPLCMIFSIEMGWW